MKRLALLLACSAGLGAPALAQQPEQDAVERDRSAPPAATAPAPAPATAHVPGPGAQHQHGGEIVVTGQYVRELNILAGTSVLEGAELQRQLRPQIGDTLTRIPGVSATSFTPGASRPVLRGFQGERIRVLTDGIGSIDVSNTSADHAVTIDPLTADRIEVLHGPAVLLFGSQAIGGAVNVIDRRIPRRVPEGGLHGDAVALYGSAADERSIGGAVDLALGGGLVAHVDGSFRKSDDLAIGGHVLSEPLRRQMLEVAAEELEEGHAEEAGEALEFVGLRGVVPNSATEQKSAGVGVALIRDRFNLGASVSRFDTRYGVPMRPGTVHHHGEEEGEEGEEGEEDHGEAPVSIDLKQVRLDLRGEYEVDGGFLESVRLRVGAADYEHTEFEGEEVGTVFMSNGAEGRLEFVQRDRNGWRGASGLQYFTRELTAIGAEAFVPPNESQQVGLFTLQEFEIGDVGAEAALRFERSRLSAPTLDLTRKFNAFSAALGASYEIQPLVRIGLNASRTERAPSPEELFASGPHIATQAFEVGDPDLRKEKSFGAEAYARVERSAFTFSLTGYGNWFDDFIYQVRSGQEADGLPVFEHRQRNARFIGIEGEASLRLFRAGGFRFVGDVVGDYVRATVEGGGPVPRIPPLRLLGGIEAQSDKLDGRVELEWVADQKRTAEHETPTDGHTMVNASLVWRPWGRERERALMLSANNILDVDARRHASFTKDFVPLPGRDIRISARFGF